MEYPLRRQVFPWLLVPGSLMFTVYEAVSRVMHTLERCGGEVVADVLTLLCLRETTLAGEGRPAALPPFHLSFNNTSMSRVRFYKGIITKLGHTCLR